jgi:hypothetical protein
MEDLGTGVVRNERTGTCNDDAAVDDMSSTGVRCRSRSASNT